MRVQYLAQIAFTVLFGVFLLFVEVASANEDRSDAGLTHEMTPRKRGYLDGLEFNGLMTIASETTVNIQSKREGETEWIKVGDTVGGLSVLGVERNPTSVQVSYGGRVRRIEISEAKILSLNIVSRKPREYTAADISFDASQIIISERADEIEETRMRKWQEAALKRERKKDSFRTGNN